MYREDKDDKVEDGGSDGLAHEIAHEFAHIASTKSPALSVRDGEIPVCGERNARDPGEDGEYQAPDGDDDDQAFADKAISRPGLEDAEVLEQQCYLDQSDRERIGEVAHIHDLEGW